MGADKSESKGSGDLAVKLVGYVLAMIIGVLVALFLMLVYVLFLAHFAPEQLATTSRPPILHLKFSLVCVSLFVWLWHKFMKTA